MADVKISALPAATVPLAGTEVLPIVQSSTTKQVSVANLTAGRAISASSITAAGRATFTASSFDAIAASTGTMQGQTSYGGVLAGSGSSYDVMLCNRNGSEVLGVIANTQNLYAAGNVGIGTSTGVNKLQVAGAVAATGGAGGYAANMALLDVSGGNAQITAIGANTSTVGTLVFQAFSSNASLGGERMRIDSSGNLLVGTTSSIGNAGILQAKGSGSVLYLETNSSSGSQNVVDITNVSNTAYVPIRFWVNGYPTTNVGSISCTTTLTSYNVTSDYRLKENIAPMTGALAKVAQLNPVTYKWKTDGSDGQGFIAHELQAIAPDCVTGEKDAVDEDGKPQYQAMDTSHLIATLVSAIQELKAEIDSLKQQINGK